MSEVWEMPSCGHKGAGLASELWQEPPWAQGTDLEAQRALPSQEQLGSEASAGGHRPRRVGGEDGSPQKGLESQEEEKE